MLFLCSYTLLGKFDVTPICSVPFLLLAIIYTQYVFSFIVLDPRLRGDDNRILFSITLQYSHKFVYFYYAINVSIPGILAPPR